MSDNNREGPTPLKFLQLLRLFWPKNTRTFARLDKFTDFTRAKFPTIKGIILDVDDTISPNRQAIFPENIAHLKKLNKQGLKIVIFSNMKKTDRYDPLPRSIKVLSNVPSKPDKRGFDLALKTLKLPAAAVAMVGDNYITDGGAIRFGIPFIHITKIPTPTKGPLELAYRALRNFYAKLSRFYHTD